MMRAERDRPGDAQLLAEYGPRIRIKVTACLRCHGASQRPYFSVTADIYRRGYTAGNCGLVACGCLHDEIVRHWPDLKPVIALHLCDDRGAPMYTEENGWYALAGYYGGLGEQYHAGNSERQCYRAGVFDGFRLPTRVECLEQFARHVRIAVPVAARLADEWKAGTQVTRRRRMANWMMVQQIRWMDDADAARVILRGAK